MSSNQFSAVELEYYSRQIALKEVGLAGQDKLKSARVLVIGAGGLGCPLLQYLVGAGIGTIGICDGDSVERRNLHRQVLYSEEMLGGNKAQWAVNRLKGLNPAVALQAIKVPLSESNAIEILNKFEIVVDASDNFATRYLINDVCVKLEIPFVGASILGFEGQVGTYNVKQADGTYSPTYRCLFPEPPPADQVPDCNQNGVLGVLPGILGCLQANEVLKMILGIGELLLGKYLIFDARTLKTRIVRYSRNQALCGLIKKSPLAQLDTHCARVIENNKSSVEAQMIKEISVQELKAMLDDKQDFQLIDVREPYEREIANIGGELIPLAEIPDSVARISRDKPVVIYCRSGGRSMKACELLSKQQGLQNLINLRGGVLAWADQIDRGMRKY